MCFWSAALCSQRCAVALGGAVVELSGAPVLTSRCSGEGCELRDRIRILVHWAPQGAGRMAGTEPSVGWQEPSSLATRHRACSPQRTGEASR
jgi:hypothetical protein